MFIEKIYRFIKFLKSQNQGRGINAQEFEDLFNQASFSLWRREFKEKDKSRWSLAYIKNFEDEQELEIDTLIPDSFGFIDHIEVEIRNEEDEVTSVQNPDWLNEQQFSERKTDSLYPPDEAHSIVKTVGNQIEVLPDIFTHYTVNGIKYPQTVKYAVTASANGRDYIFDEAKSTDTDWPEIAHGEIIGIICKALGINLNNDWLLQYDNLQKQAEVTYDKSEHNK